MSGLSIAEKPEGVEFRETPDGVQLKVPDRGLADKTIVLSIGSGKSVLKVEAGLSSRVRIALNFIPGQASEEAAATLEFSLEAGACADVFYLLSGDKVPNKITAKAVYHLKKHSSLNLWTFFGDSSAHLRHEVFFDEPHGFASMNGLSLLANTSDVTHELLANHRSGACISRQFYKSIVTQEAKTAFDSLVSVAEGAAKTDSKQLNKNLILSRQARALSRPELKISADDVTCAHGSATGEIDKTQLFYLRSRGIDEKSARFMMIEGFAREVFEAVPDLPVKSQIEKWMTSKINQLAMDTVMGGMK